MFGVLNFRVYLIIAFFVGAICFATAYFDSNQTVASFFTEIGDTAAQFGLGNAIANVVVQPIAFAFSDIYWAIAAGVLWPLLVIWFILFLVVLGFSIFGPAIAEIDTVGNMVKSMFV